MKKFAVLALSLLLSLCLLSSCGEDFRDDLSSAELTGRISKELSEEFSTYGEEQLLLIFGSDRPYISDCSIIYSKRTENIDEVGIFHAKDKTELRDIKAGLEEYIDETAASMRGFVMSYAPDEAKKLDSATVFTVGNYAVYTILSPSESQKIQDAFSSLLKG